MKHLLLTTIEAVVLVGCGESQQSAPTPEAKPEPPTAKAPNISIHQAVFDGNIEAVKQHLAAGTDANAKTGVGETPMQIAYQKGHTEIVELLIANGADGNAKGDGQTPLHGAAYWGSKEIVQLLIAKGVDVNAKTNDGETPLDLAKGETSDLLRKHGGKTGEELKAEGKQKQSHSNS